jgi:hypothetical protein
VVNRGVAGCQRDHYPISVIVNGIFWHDPAAFSAIYKLFRSALFGMDRGGALDMLQRCFTHESAGLSAAAKTHDTAADSYRAFVEPVHWLDGANRDMCHMRANNVRRYIEQNRRALAGFSPQ